MPEEEDLLLLLAKEPELLLVKELVIEPEREDPEKELEDWLCSEDSANLEEELVLVVWLVKEPEETELVRLL